MGVDLALTRFFDHCAQSSPFKGPMLALGSLTLRETPEVIARYAADHRYATLAEAPTVAALMRDRYGIADYRSCDINGLADLYLDLGAPLPEQHRSAYGSILNGGTLEHIFDIRQAMENIHAATGQGGLMIHTCPLTWFDHGFFNLNPVFFHQTAEANRYAAVAEGYYFCAGTWDGQDQPFVHLKGVDDIVATVGRPLEALFQQTRLPANVMHLIALRKTADGPFRLPTQESH